MKNGFLRLNYNNRIELVVDVMVVKDKKNFRVKFKSGMEVPVEF